MSEAQMQGLVKGQTLTDAELASIEQLMVTCNRFENLRMRLGMEMLRLRSGKEIYDYLYYEQDMLVGYLGLDDFWLSEREAVAMVHPDFRRKGIFRQLLTSAMKAGEKQGLQKLVLVCEQTSQSGQACAKAIGATLDFSEHEMVLGTFRERATFDDRLIFRKATSDDLDLLVTILNTEYGTDEVSTQERVIEMLKRPISHFYIATLGGDDTGCHEPVGSLRLDEVEQEIGIYGFVVRPEYRGRGYGRQMLAEAIRTVKSSGQKSIMLDVETDNTNAVGLYLSSGFEIRTTYDYYSLTV